MNDTFTIGRQRFSCGIDPRTGTLCIQSIHPYDETNYHWARQGVTGHSWFVFREGKRVATLGQPESGPAGTSPPTRRHLVSRPPTRLSNIHRLKNTKEDN